MNNAHSNRIVSAPSKRHTIATNVSRRICIADACPTVLSIYNVADSCWVHEQPERRTGAIFRR